MQQQQAAALAQQQQQDITLQQQNVQQEEQQPQQAVAIRLPPLPRVRDLPWKEFFTNKPFLAIVMAHSAFGKQQEHRATNASSAAFMQQLLLADSSGFCLPKATACCSTVLPAQRAEPCRPFPATTAAAVVVHVEAAAAACTPATHVHE